MTLNGGTGDDIINSGREEDTYLFSRGDGRDTITANRGYVDKDKLVFGAGITQDQLSARRVGDDLVLGIADPAHQATDQITFKRWFSGDSSKLDQLEFADGGTMTGAQLTAMGNVIAGTEGNDMIDVPYGASGVDGLGGDDTITAYTYTWDPVKLRGGDGNDKITYSYFGQTTVEGGAGNDVLQASDMNASGGAKVVLNGGTGDDSIYSGREEDTYLFSRGDGRDTITANRGSADKDKLVFGAGITQDQLSARRVGDDLVLGIADPAHQATDQITFKRWFSGDSSKLDQLEFADGGTMTGAQLTALGNVIAGTEGNDTINAPYGVGGVDGLGGDDTIAAYEGMPDPVKLRGGDGNDKITFSYYGQTTAEGGAGNDVLQVSNPNADAGGKATLNGGTGDDTITSGQEEDTYLFNLGDGRDTITSNRGSRDKDKLVFGAGITLDQLSARRVGDDLVLGIADPAHQATDQITFKRWFSGDSSKLDQVVFADGGTMTGVQLTSLGNVILGTSGNDLLSVPVGVFGIDGLEGNDNLAGGQGDDSLFGNLGDDVLVGNAGNDTLDGGQGIDSMTGSSGDDIYIVDNVGDRVNEVAGDGSDVIRTSVTYSLPENVEILVSQGLNTIDGIGNKENNLIIGNAAANLIRGAEGNDILQGGGGADNLQDNSGNNLLDGGAGDDVISGGDGNELFIGGVGNDAIATSGGADVIAFNRGDGQDVIAGSSGSDNVISLGKGIVFADLLFSKKENDLVLSVGASESMTLRDWYLGADSHSIKTLQMLIEGGDYDTSSADPLKTKKIQQFDFDGLAKEFDTARSNEPGLNSWALSSSLLNFYLAGSDTTAIGGDLAYQYGRSGALTGISIAPAQAVLAAGQFGNTPQTLRSAGQLQDATFKLI
ncbi:bifunctional hemolysin/adenylate cyclase precursor [Duganella sp. HH101]|nr:bifunctional hemolysin/adenylate cyclase precursor [Duganella sp. HH101]